MAIYAPIKRMTADWPQGWFMRSSLNSPPQLHIDRRRSTSARPCLLRVWLRYVLCMGRMQENILKRGICDGRRVLGLDRRSEASFLKPISR